MVVLRLRRGGRRHDPHYRIVAQEKRSKLNGAYIESIGHYHPVAPNKELVIDKERAKHWLSQGAQLSVTVNNLFVKDGVLPKEAKISRVYSQKKKVEEEKPAEAKPAEEVKEAETKAEEPAEVEIEKPQEKTEDEKLEEEKK